MKRPLLPIYSNVQETFSYKRGQHANDSAVETIIIPDEFRLLDVSEDHSFIAFVDHHFILYVHQLENDSQNGWRPVEKPVYYAELPKQLYIDNTYLFLSVSCEGNAVISSLQVDKDGAPIYGKAQQNKHGNTESDGKNDFKGCRVFRRIFQDKLDLEFNGRAVYVGDRLVLVNTDSISIHRRWSYNLLDIHKNIGEYAQVTNLNPPETFWAWSVSKKPPPNNAAQRIINMTQLIKDEIFMTFYFKNITKVWSLFDGSLITSIVLEDEESVMAVSNDKLHLATYSGGSDKRCVNIYDTETLLRLHSFKPKGIQGQYPHSRVRAIKFCPYQHYLIIASTNISGDQKETFFEVWLIEKERCIVNKRNDGALIRGLSPAINITEIKELKKTHRLTGISESGFFTFKFDVFFASATQGIGEIKIEKIPIFGQEQEIIEEKRLWVKYECNEITNKKDNAAYYEILGPLDENGVPIDKEGFTYILRFGQCMVRLWKLTSTEGENDNKNMIPFQYLDEEKYKNKVSELVFIRGYKGHHSESNFKDIWKIAPHKENDPQVRFMSDEGRIIVNIEDVHSNNSKDEFFLPLPGLDPQPTDHFNYIESLSQALYCLCYDNKAAKEETRLSKSNVTKKNNNTDDADSIREPGITNTIINLLKETLSRNKDTTFFKTRSGNRVLAMLASFDVGQTFFENILITDNFPMTIFSFQKSKEESENFLTVLIKRRKIELFELLFNEILYEYHQSGSNNLFPLMDTLLELRNMEIEGVLLRCTQKLSDIEIKPEKSGLLPTEYYKKFSYSSIYHFTKTQQLKKYHSHWVWKLFYKITRSSKVWELDKEIISVKNTKDSLKRRTNLCIIPLPSYNVYNVFKYGCSVEDDEISRSVPKGEKPEKKFHTLNVIEVLIDHKWRESARDGLLGILVFHLVYYVFYTIGISFPEEVFGYVPGTPIRDSKHLACIAMMVSTGAFLFFQEMVQMKAWKLSYFKSIFNYVDLAAFILPLTTLALLVTNGTYLYEVSSITILILWVHFFLRLRVIPTVGTLSEIILRLAKKFFPVIFTLIMVVVAFTHAFIVLLRRKDDAYFQEKYDGTMVTTNESNLLNGASVTLSDQSQQNPFKDVFLAFTTVWFFTSGTFDPVFSGDANSPMVTILAILFSFCTGLIVLNVVIALMTGAIESTKKKGNRNWYVHYIAVVAEIELFWGLFFKKNDPIYVYYWTYKYKIREKCHDFGNDIEALRATLGFKKSRTTKCAPYKYHTTD